MTSILSIKTHSKRPSINSSTFLNLKLWPFVWWLEAIRKRKLLKKDLLEISLSLLGKGVRLVQCRCRRCDSTRNLLRHRHSHRAHGTWFTINSNSNFPLNSCRFCMQGNRIYAALCNLKWYNLSAKDKRIYLQLVLFAQHPHLFFVAGIAPLNMETWLKVSLANTRYIFSQEDFLDFFEIFSTFSRFQTAKSIYSFAMILSARIWTTLKNVFQIQY